MIPSSQADTVGSEQTPGERWKPPITSLISAHVISETLIKTKRCKIVPGCAAFAVMAPTLPWARSAPSPRGCFALSCLFSSYWGLFFFFWQDSCYLLRVEEKGGESQSSWKRPGEPSSCQREKPQHPPAAPWRVLGPVRGLWGAGGAAVGQEHSWEGPDGPRSPGSQSPQ